MLLLAILPLLAADVGDLLEAEEYDKVYPMVAPTATDGAAWFGFLYEESPLNVVRFARAAEGTKRYHFCRLAFAAVAQRQPQVRVPLLGRALNCAIKGRETEALGLLAGQLLKTEEGDRALHALATLEEDREGGAAEQRRLAAKCKARWCHASLLEMASEKEKYPRTADLELVQHFSDLKVGVAAFERLRKATKKRNRRDLTKVLSAEALVGRTLRLMSAHDNVGALAAADAALTMELSEGDRCDMMAARARTLRKMRKHKDAVKGYGAYLTAKCGGESAPAVHYGRLFSQNIVDDKRIPEMARAAYKAHPNHRLSDDFLFFIAEHYQRRNKITKAVETYTELVTKNPDGDMAEEADWRRGWLALQQGDAALAKSRLDTFLRQRASSQSHLSEHQLRARYWRVTLEPPAQREAALRLIIGEHPATWQALLAAASLGKEKPLPAPLAAMPKAAGNAIDAAPLADDPRFVQGLALIELELNTQALALLQAIPVKSLTMSQLLPLTHALLRAGSAADAVGRLRHAPALRGAPTPEARAIWKLAYPLPFKTDIVAQAKANELPAALLFGLIREESGFDPGALSWAGAKGLTQCMPGTAKWVARKHRIKGYSWSKMDQPELNLKVGARYLGGLIKRWKKVLPMAVGSYNAGPAALKRIRKASPKLRMDRFVEELPIRQTREYIQRVLASAWTYAQLYPELGGLDLRGMHF